MGPSLIINSSNISYSYKGFDSGNFVLNIAEGKETIEIATPLALDTEFHDLEFDVYFLIKRHIKESDIFQVVDSNNARIGWCIPTNALGSDLHDYATDPHFLRYAYKAIEVALKNLNGDLYTADAGYNESSQINFSDIFHPYTALLVVSRTNISERGALFDFKRALPSLISHGYQPLTNKNPDLLKHHGPSPTGKKLKITLTSHDIENQDLINSILSSILAYEENPTFRFFYVYQIFELLIENILKIEQEDVIEQLYKAKLDPARSREILRELKDMTGEKDRIKLLIEKYSACSSGLEDIRDACRNFLALVGNTCGTNFEDYFYPVRNFMVHRLRELPQAENSPLSPIVEHTLSLLPRILFNFKKPAA
ncbi:hypothetical protein IRZ48_00280 [Pseudomonas fulva]|uniref:hypothetical protein n=1 Tax=Pseudomonas fulva TaxID=47880 RepID=UPI0018AA652A|nr:hypothetical protein [Pseudomonas fulva]MBF8637663.1 hypothetical protein [Pseudomonas fulva]MBF8687023.1 hypothetical protein [Pseudomonas fulva]